jgi:hypothetical protein
MTASAAGELDFRLRGSGTDLSSAVYTSGYNYITTSSGPTRANNNTAGFAGIGFNGSARSIVTMDIYGPAASATKAFTALFGGGSYQGNSGGLIDTSTAYDGFTLYETAITLTGIVRVYGYKN